VRSSQASVSRAGASGKPAVGCAPKGHDEERRRRRSPRSSALPPPPQDRTLDYALSREELRDIEPGEVVLATEELEGFKKVVLPALEAADEARLTPREGEKKRRGRAPSYTAIDYWRMEMLRRVLASHSTQATRDWLTTDKAARTRELLGFDKRRAHYGGKPKKWMDGVPSDGWMSDFRTKWLSEDSVADLMQKLERWALAEKMAKVPGMREECRVLYADGSKLETHGTAPKLKKDEDGNVIAVLNAYKKGRDGLLVRAITAPEAGYVSDRGGNADHSGHGWNIIMVMSSKGTVLAHHNVPLHAGETTTLREMVPEVGQTLEMLGDEPELRVMSTDAAFHSHETRAALRTIGVIENTHLTSHARTASAERDAENRENRLYPIKGKPNWHLTGHRELRCACGKGKTSRMVRISKKTGVATARLKGECDTCKGIVLTSGEWRRHRSEDRTLVKCLSHEHEDIEWDIGNPLTYKDPLARAYGRGRFNGQEGAFGSQFTQRFKMLKSKRWFYRQSQVDLEVAAVITITHALSLERWRRMGEPREAADESSEAIAA
jgi:hypothetical protein